MELADIDAIYLSSYILDEMVDIVKTQFNMYRHANSLFG